MFVVQLGNIKGGLADETTLTFGTTFAEFCRFKDESPILITICFDNGRTMVTYFSVEVVKFLDSPLIDEVSASPFSKMLANIDHKTSTFKRNTKNSQCNLKISKKFRNL
jgi:hypothetical protein